MPSSPSYIRDYKQEAATEDSKRKQFRLMRIRARRKLARRGTIPIGYDVDHIKELGKGGSNKLSNLQLLKSSINRSYPRTSTGKMI